MSGKIWILDTETKGTGAQMVPLEKLGGSRPTQGVVVVQEPKPKPEPAPRPKGPRRFKVVDVMTRRVLAEDADVRATVELLQGVRSPVDVTIHVWEEGAAAWQQLSRRETQMLWNLRTRASAAGPS